MQSSSFKTTVGVLVALIAFAGNSVLCRLAIGSERIDATSFTLIRLAAGAVALWMLSQLRPAATGGQSLKQRGWLAPVMLLGYAAAFSYAYILLDTGVGALVLFACVQITLIIVSLVDGEALGLRKLFGVLIAFSGLLYLLWPREQDAVDISLAGCALMALSGVAWGIYTAIGKGSQNPLADTARNFRWACLWALPLLGLFLFNGPSISTSGLVLAAASGALTSGLGYTIWYAVLPGMSSIQAGVAQLSVPFIAALGGVLFVREAFDLQLLIAMVLTALGIALVISAPRSARKPGAGENA